MKQSHYIGCYWYSNELWLVQENHATVKLDLTALGEMKTYIESRIELRNLQIIKKMVEKSR